MKTFDCWLPTSLLRRYPKQVKPESSKDNIGNPHSYKSRQAASSGECGGDLHEQYKTKAEGKPYAQMKPYAAPHFAARKRNAYESENYCGKRKSYSFVFFYLVKRKILGAFEFFLGNIIIQLPPVHSFHIVAVFHKIRRFQVHHRVHLLAATDVLFLSADGSYKIIRNCPPLFQAIVAGIVGGEFINKLIIFLYFFNREFVSQARVNIVILRINECARAYLHVNILLLSTAGGYGCTSFQIQACSYLQSG